jgi:RNA polymerase sigma-70 factor, ECF subfamily
MRFRRGSDEVQTRSVHAQTAPRRVLKIFPEPEPSLHPNQKLNLLFQTRDQGFATVVKMEKEILKSVIQQRNQERIQTVQHISTEDSDAVLVVAIGRGQQRALAEVYHRHGGQAFRLAERLLIDTKRAEDVVQDVFLHLWRNPESFDAERASLRTWLLLKTHGKAVDTIRAEAARRGREERILNDRTNNEADLDREIWDLTVADRVQQAIGELPEGERQAINLAYFGGHTYTEVAVALGEPEGTIKSRIRKGLTTLRRSLGDLRFDGEHSTPFGAHDTGSSTPWGRSKVSADQQTHHRNAPNSSTRDHQSVGFRTPQDSGTTGMSHKGEKES